MGWIRPAWPAPPTVYALSTTRTEGFGQGRYASLNLSLSAGDDPEHVSRNRLKLLTELGPVSGIQWLAQSHSDRVADVSAICESSLDADAVITSTPGLALAVLTADCLPVLICNRAGTRVAAVHAGWRGLAAGIIGKTIAQFDSPASDLIFWLGPAIGPAAFEVGADVKAAFAAFDNTCPEAFVAKRKDKWLCDLYALARAEIQAFGGGEVYGGGSCTYRQQTTFFSYRRDGVTGRMASLIWVGTMA